MKLYDLSDFTTLVSQYRNFDHKEIYKKNEKPYGYILDDLCECPSGIQYNTWLKTNRICYSLDKDPFNLPSDPFLGKNEFYDRFFKEDLYDFLSGQVDEIINKIESIHNSMKCR
jgi:hypothetical protein